MLLVQRDLEPFRGHWALPGGSSTWMNRSRTQRDESRLGGWLDTILDDVSNQIFLLSTAWGVYHHEATGLLRTLVLAAAIGRVRAGRAVAVLCIQAPHPSGLRRT